MTTTTQKLQVDRRSGLTHQEFVDEYRNPNKPVIITDLSKDWRATTEFTPEFFKENFADRIIVLGDKPYNVADLMDLLVNSTKDNPAPYPLKMDLRKEFAELVPYVTPRPSITIPDRTSNPLIPSVCLNSLYDLEIFFGGPGGEFPYLHYDYLGLYAFISQVYGEKEFTLFPPEQQPYLYPRKDSPWLSDIENHHNPDLKKYPLFAQATPTTVIISAGETMFIPCGWYHTARSLTVTISVAFDQLCQSNWDFFINECVTGRRKKYPIRSRMIEAYLTVLGSLMTASERLSGTR
ncbi:cupin-like domain-containing protein [Kamptonema sp. UHCC 0994]|uniref:cupin-like domain-containing protein n=1 Tax=Kamptonema sp. UHCC 0994 TaxID=3031329 RepID=UPI0023B90220|nr:cupin-like domain-containing protein [Kamptonema sp. UHCC 0994]MDF0555070.1 cupin-like domain-containing protein [Kamptonema sp. UHCC 0994]